MALKNPRTGSNSGKEVLKTHRTGFGPRICSLSSTYMGEVGKTQITELGCEKYLCRVTY
jgi:hypothetical protein